jgi:hypothetical protein
MAKKKKALSEKPNSRTAFLACDSDGDPINVDIQYNSIDEIVYAIEMGHIEVDPGIPVYVFQGEFKRVGVIDLAPRFLPD